MNFPRQRLLVLTSRQFSLAGTTPYYFSSGLDSSSQGPAQSSLHHRRRKSGLELSEKFIRFHPCAEFSGERQALANIS